MQHHTHNIQLSNHVKNKIKYHHASSLSRSSDELNISDHTSDDNGKVTFLIFLYNFISNRNPHNIIILGTLVSQTLLYIYNS